MGDVKVTQKDMSIGGAQYIAGGDITFGAARNKDDFLSQLAKLRAEFAVFAQQAGLDEEKRIEVDAKLQLASVEANKVQPAKQTLIERLSGAKTLLEGVATAGNLVGALSTAINTTHKLFS
jgi:FAD synthase